MVRNTLIKTLVVLMLLGVVGFIIFVPVGTFLVPDLKATNAYEQAHDNEMPPYRINKTERLTFLEWHFARRFCQLVQEVHPNETCVYYIYQSSRDFKKGWHFHFRGRKI